MVCSWTSLIFLLAGIQLAASYASADDKARDAFLRKPAFQNNLDANVQKRTGGASPRVLSDEEVARRKSAQAEGDAPALVTGEDRAPSEASPEATPAVPPTASTVPNEAAPAPATETAEGRPSDKNRKYGIIALLVVIAIVVRSFRRKR